jgi:periplasmic protein TonB
MNRSVDWLFIVLLFLSTALHAGLLAAVGNWERPHPPLAMPALQITMSAPSSLHPTAFPRPGGKAIPRRTENPTRWQRPRPSPAKAPTPPSPSPPSDRASRRSVPLPVIRTIAAPPSMHLSSALSSAPSLKPKPVPAPQPTPTPRPIREAEPKPQLSPESATRPAAKPVPEPETASLPAAKVPSPEQANRSFGEHAAIGPAAKRDTGAKPTGRAQPGPELDAYLRRVVQQIEAKKHYPLLARTRRIEGRATVAFRISPQGGLRTPRVLNHSGYDILDRAALRAVSDAAPFPKPPQRFRDKPLSLEVVLVFSLESPDTP